MKNEQKTNKVLSYILVIVIIIIIVVISMQLTTPTIGNVFNNVDGGPCGATLTC